MQTITGVLVFVTACAFAQDIPKVIVFHLADDFGWANAGWHRPEGFEETQTPNMDSLVKAGIELDRAHSFRFCSPSRCSLQSGRLPTHVNVLNLDMSIWNPKNPLSGYAGIAPNFTCIGNQLQKAGWSTHQIGKWDAGMALHRQSPHGRGYDTSFGYFHHANDYWNEHVGNYVDLWNTTIPAHGKNGSCNNVKGGCPGVAEDPKITIGPEELYEEKKFLDEVLRVIRQHDGKKPLFINYDSHIVHEPLEAVDEFFHDLNNVTSFSNDYDKHRQMYAAMVKYVDYSVGQIVNALQERGWWEDTLWFHQSDNGGPSFTGSNHTANNYPLKGSKMTYWDGGFRVNAFAGGPYLTKVAPAMKGTKLEGFVTIADYYRTICSAAGIVCEDPEAKAVGLPDLDSISMWDYFTGKNSTPPRDEMYMDENVVYKGQFKYIENPPKAKGIQYACWMGVYYPNITESPKCDRAENCPNGGCLYNVFDDPSEHINLSDDPSHSDVLKQMQALLAEEQKGFFNPDRTGGDKNLAGKIAKERYGGFWGPFLHLDSTNQQVYPLQ
eukprot:m.87747 g.87747  ORF g.87747 m.87747 type:complete len:551 (+) comp21420_c0_seq3:56-1708(+)